MGIDRTDIEAHVQAALSGLKDFQTATVDVVHRRLFKDQQKSMLIADEVGLGKTIVAKGIIARELMARLKAGRRSPFKVTYVCSNQVIAGENIKKLNIFPEHGVVEHVARRIAYLAYERDYEGESYRKALVLNTLTPGTSFRVSNSPGTKHERAIIYALLCEDPDFAARKKGLSCLLRGGVRQNTPDWREWLEGQRGWDLRPDLPDRFLRLMSRRRLSRDYGQAYDALDGRKTVSLEDATYEFAGFLRANNETHYHGACLQLVRALRRLLIDACLEYVDADLYILDEFQRFRTLIDPDSDEEEALIARRVFRQKRARILLLSATPFKAFTGDLDQANGEDHYRDFRTVLRFLTDGNAELLQAYDAHRGALYRQLLSLDKESLDLSTDHRVQVEGVLRKIMCRTERHSVATDPKAMIADCWRTERVPFDVDDISNFVETDHIAEALSRVYKRGRHAVSKPVEYCKSAPFPLSFLDGYVLKKTLAQLKRDNEVQKALRQNRHAWLDLSCVNHYRLAVGAEDGEPHGSMCAHARVAQLVESAVGEHGAGLLWVPPSLPYYPLAGAFQGSGGFSKTLVFSAWVMVPRMIASLVSYEVERRTVGDSTTQDDRETAPRTYFAPEGKKNYRRHPVPLLTFSRAVEKRDRQVQNMSNFCLLYPSPSLMRMVTAQELMSLGEDLGTLRSRIADRIRTAIEEADLTRFENAAGEPDKWYWAAAPLLDRSDSALRRLVGKWMYDPDSESGFFSAKDSDSTAKAEHFDQLRESFNAPNGIGLGPMPNELPTVLADMVLGSPAVVALRSLPLVFAPKALDAHDLHDAANIAGEFLNLFNKPESITAIRLGATAGSYWHQSIRYCADGCLQAVLDEYLHLLKGQSGDRDDAVRDVAGTINISTASINVDGYDSFMAGKPQKMRCHYAVEFGNQKIETDEGQKRASSIRSNFNSPFRPFVLATTSIGQEGLDFHQYCRRIVHWNLPSNPIDLEQREGRINRYKGLVVRQQLAKRYGEELRGPHDVGDPWERLFHIADQRERVATGKCELIPYWHVDTDEYRIERLVPMYPFSRDEAKLERILKTLAIYRLAFGQPRQVELVEHLLEKDFKPAEIEQICSQLMVNLSPITYPREDGKDADVEDGQAVRTSVSQSRLLPTRSRQRTSRVPEFDSSAIEGLGDYLRILSQEFPRLNRHSRKRIKTHPLKRLNDETFRPIFQNIVASASDGQLKAKADLNIGGHWYRVPNILIEHPTREPWENVDGRGRAIVQIHFEDSYAIVRLSLLLQYNLLSTEENGSMPGPVNERYRGLCTHLKGTGASVDHNLSPFKHWNFKQYTLWAKPIVSHKYHISSLPSDDELCKTLGSLITHLSEAMTVQ